VVTALVIWQFWPEGKPAGSPDANTNKPAPRADTKKTSPPIVHVGGKAPSGSVPPKPDANAAPADLGLAVASDANAAITQIWAIPAATAVRLVDQGNQLLSQDKKIQGRAVLTKALLSEKLSQASAAAVRAKLEALADEMIFSRNVVDGDPYTATYTFAKLEVLTRVERKLSLRVPNQIVLKINKLSSGTQIQAGQTIKVIRGPFHAIVDKSDFTMDIFLCHDGSDPVFIKRVRVGLGKNGYDTPAGLWQINGKTERTPWYPPANAEQQHAIACDQPGYPLGKKGYWLGLKGIDQHTASADSYGIHGTNEPDSIGRAASLGCIRLADADIELVFFLLYDQRSTVRVKP